jgi:hypothetical protein
MAYVTGYQHDVFISYSHLDNEPLGSGKGWVTTLAGYLKQELDRGLGSRDTQVWMDSRKLTSHEPFPAQIGDGLDNCATLLVVASQGYLQSEWCQRERNGFLNAARAKGAATSRIFRVDVDRIPPADFPPELADLLGYPFWTLDRNEYPRTLGMASGQQIDDDYYAALTKLRIELGAELKRLRRGNSPQAAVPAVFLAEVTDDLDDLREELYSYITQAGLTALPDRAYPRDDYAEYQRRMDADLRRSAVFVQLLSEVAGKQLPSWPKRLPAVQSNQARLSASRVMQWRSRELHLDTIRNSNPDHYSLLNGPEVIACGIEEFKRTVVDTARAPAKRVQPRAEAIAADSLVFVNSDSPDREIAREVCEILKQEGIGYSLPLFDENTKPADVRADLEMNLATCDGLILVYGNTPVTWVRRQLAQGRKILSQREAPLTILGLVEGPPPDKQGIGFDMPNMRSLDCRNGVCKDAVMNFITALRT